MKVSSAAAAAAVSPGPSCALKGVRSVGVGDAPPPSGGGGGAGSPPPPFPPPRGSLPPLCPTAAAASLLMDMRGCYSRLAALVPTLPRHRRVSKVEILQHVIDYIWDLQLELQHPMGAGTGNLPAARGTEEPAGPGTEAACVNPDDRILCR